MSNNNNNNGNHNSNNKGKSNYWFLCNCKEVFITFSEALQSEIDKDCPANIYLFKSTTETLNEGNKYVHS